MAKSELANIHTIAVGPYLFALGVVAIVATMIFAFRSPKMPHATCPATAFVKDREWCGIWARQSIADTKIAVQSDGSCRICNVPLGPVAERSSQQ